MVTIQEKLQFINNEINPRLNAFLDHKLKEAKKLHPQAGILVEEVKRFINLGGKRVRPAFVYAGYLSVGGKKETIFDLACSVELLHTWALIHDDIIDRSLTRRGEKTSHIYWKDQFRVLGLKGDKDHFGISTAILAGDLAYSLADSVFDQYNSSEEVRKYWEAVKFEVMHGEYLDVLFSFKDTALEADIRSVLEYKTAKYTVQRPLQIGASFGRATSEQIKTLEAYGSRVGQVFQIQDDIQGIFGEEKKLGKSVSSDLIEGKKTLLIFSAQKRASVGEAKVLVKVLGNPQATEKEIQDARDVIKKVGALEESQKLVDQLSLEAIKEVEKSTLTTEGKEWLIQASDYLKSLAH